MNGRRHVRSCGPTGNVTFITTTADGSPDLATSESRFVRCGLYYFDFKDTEKQDCQRLLSSLPALHTVPPWLQYPIKAHGNESRPPAEIDCPDPMSKRLPSHPLVMEGRTVHIVDAVDESPNKPGISSLCEKVLRLVKELVDLRRPDIRVYVSNHPEVDIQTVLDPLVSHAVFLHHQGGQRSNIVITSVVEPDANMRRCFPVTKS